MGTKNLQKGDYIFRIRKTGPEFHQVNETTFRFAFAGTIRLNREVLDGICSIPVEDRAPLAPVYCRLSLKTYRKILKKRYANQLPTHIKRFIAAARKREVSEKFNPQQRGKNNRLQKVSKQSHSHSAQPGKKSKHRSSRATAYGLLLHSSTTSNQIKPSVQ